MKAANPTMGVVTGLAGAPSDAPGSMMYGASMAVLHKPSLSMILLVQQDVCGPGKGPGMISSEEGTSTYVHWLRNIVYLDEYVMIF